MSLGLLVRHLTSFSKRIYSGRGHMVTRMIPLDQAITHALNTLGEHPDIDVEEMDDFSYDITLTWPDRGRLKMNVTVGDRPGTSLIDIFERENVSHVWKEYFLAFLYGNLEEVDPALYMAPS